MEDPTVPYRQQLRNYHPKRSEMHRIHRWRQVNNNDGLITKVLLLEYKWTLAPIQCNRDYFDLPPISTKNSIRILNEINSDWTGLSSGVPYSQKKKKRWLLPKLLDVKLPEYDTHDLPLELVTTANARFHGHKTHRCSTDYWFFNAPTGSHKLQRLADSVKSVRMKMRDGREYSFKGRANLSLLRDLYKNNADEDFNATKLHVQFQSVEFKKSPRLHNSRIYDYIPCELDEFWSEPEAKWALRFDMDVASSGYLEDDENLDVDEYWGTYSPLSPVSKPLTLGDFVDAHNIPRRSRSSKSGLKEWVLV